ncbi:hypothetical protein COO72_05165 [Bifidobacterium callitrichos]|nr:hypothetical protein COO72_05165 [Bifidobacterium callitrichos]
MTITTRKTATTLTAALFAILSIAGLSACGSGDTATANAAQTHVKTIVVATGGSPKPHTYVGADGQLTGYDIDILKAVDERLPEYRFEYQKVAFNALLTGLDSGRAQVSANSFTVTPERVQKYEYSEPYFHEKYGILTNDKDQPIHSLEELGGKTTLTAPGTATAAVLEALNKNQLKDNPIRIDYADTDPASIYQKLNQGAYDFQIGSQSSYGLYDKEFDLNVTFTPLSDKESEALGSTDHVFFYPKSEEGRTLKKTIDTQLTALDKDGTLKQLSAKYFNGEDYSPSASA